MNDFDLRKYLAEGRLFEEDTSDVDITPLGALDDEIKKALEAAAKEEGSTNEGILTISLIAAAVPGMVKAVMKVIGVLAKKNGIQLDKADPKWYEIIGDAAGKADDYLDSPFNFMLRPFVRDSIKRAKYAKLIKAATLALIGITGAINIAKAKEVTTLINTLAPEIGKELVQSIAEKNADKVGQLLKVAFQAIQAIK
jgi:hypothetical protein